jgi:hypothetical protein
MRPRLAYAAAALATAAVLAPGAARADDSSQGPMYVQGGLGLNFWDFPHLQFGLYSTSYSWTGFRPEVEFGFHPSGRHDGFVIGVRQEFVITAIQQRAAGMTVVRGGWDIPIKVGTLELNIDPFATVGIGYVFDGPSAGILATGGLDAKLFLVKGFYAFARPAELGVQCLHDSGNCAFVYAMSLGAGYAFGGH